MRALQIAHCSNQNAKAQVRQRTVGPEMRGNAGCSDAAQRQMSEKAQKKGPLVRNKRPKSREETPKEGGGNARDRVAALQQYATAVHK
jgi:hypothetical protein